MRSRWSWIIVAFLILVASNATSIAVAWELGRPDLAVISARQQFRASICDIFRVKQSAKAELAARQDLQSEVCIAKADGRLSNSECRTILADAKQILEPGEYEAFEQSLISLSPEFAKTRERQSAKVVRQERATVMTIKEQSSEPTIPTNVIRPERIAFRSKVW